MGDIAITYAQKEFIKKYSNNKYDIEEIPLSKTYDYIKKINIRKDDIITIIGGGMIKESFDDDSENENDDVSFKTMIVLAIATSIDALAIGITFAFLKVNLVLAISFIGIITFMLSVAGTKIGNRFGDKYESKAELVGGIILILLGAKILLEHLGIIGF